MGEQVTYEVGSLVMFDGAKNDPGDRCLEEIVWKITEVIEKDFFKMEPEWVPEGFRLHDSWGMLSWVDIDTTARTEDLRPPPEMLLLAIVSQRPEELPCRDCISSKRKLAWYEARAEVLETALRKCRGTADQALEEGYREGWP